MLRTSKVKGLIIAIVVGALAGASTCCASEGMEKEQKASTLQAKKVCKAIDAMIPILKMEIEKRQIKLDQGALSKNSKLSKEEAVEYYTKRINKNKARIEALTKVHTAMNCDKKSKM